MSLFTKYLTIIQEAYYRKKQEDSLTFSGNKIFNQERELGQFYGSGEYKGESNPNLSEKEIQAKIAANLEMDKEKKDVYIDPYAEYEKKKRENVNIHSLSAELKKDNPFFFPNQMEQIYKDAELSYMYAYRFKDVLNTKDYEQIKYNLEKSISKYYDFALKYAINILKSRWTGEFAEEAEENISLDPKSYAKYIKLKEVKI